MVNKPWMISTPFFLGGMTSTSSAARERFLLSICHPKICPGTGSGRQGPGRPWGISVKLDFGLLGQRPYLLITQCSIQVENNYASLVRFQDSLCNHPPYCSTAHLLGLRSYQQRGLNQTYVLRIPCGRISALNVETTQVVEIGGSLCTNVVDRLLGVTSGASSRLRRFYVGRSKLA